MFFCFLQQVRGNDGLRAPKCFIITLQLLILLFLFKELMS